MRRSLTTLLAAVLFLSVGTQARGDDWPQWMGPQRDGVWREKGILDKFPAGGLKARWRVEVGVGYAGPAVASGKVYITDYLTKGDTRGNFSGRTKLKGQERVRCLDAATGALVWKHTYDCPYEISYPGGPRCTPTVHDGKVYTLGAMGNLVCLSADKGELLWSHDLKEDYKIKAPLWGFCGHPLVDGNKLICLVGGKDSVAVAFDKDSGKQLWHALSADQPGYCPPTMIEAGKTRQLIVWHAESINSLEPDTGKVHWSVPLAPSYGMSITAPQKLGDHLYASGIGGKAVLLKLADDRPAATEVWSNESKTAVYCSNSTPFLEDDTIYGVDCMTGYLRGVKLSTGERLWETLAPVGGKRLIHGTAFLIKNGDRFFLASETGDLIIARLSPKEYREISRTKLLQPTSDTFGRKVVWSYPAFADKCIFWRNDKELVCVSLADGH
jgi:outer membrane protein assembly factor BamB